MTMMAKDAAFEKATYNADAHTIEWVMSSEAPDRDGEVLEVDGWVERGQHIPVLWSHNSRGGTVHDVLGAVDKAWNSGKKRIGAIRFSQAHDIAKIAETMVAEGILRNGSVGFRPISWVNADGSKADRKDGEPMPYPMIGRRYTKMEQVEFSITPVPSNLFAQSKSIETEELKQWIADIVRTIVRDEMEEKRNTLSALDLFRIP